MGSVTILKASAGSGKTYRLVGEYIRAVVAEPELYRHILAVTFTNKATEELKGRIVRQLHALAVGADSPYLAGLMEELGLSDEQVRQNARRAQGNILHDYSHFAVLTIDKFFQNIIRAFLRELGITPDFTLELHTDSLLEQAADALIERTATDPALREWIEGFVSEQLDNAASWDVRGKLASAGRELFGEQWDMESSAHEGMRERLTEMSHRIAALHAQAVGRLKAVAAEAMGLIDRAGLSVEDFAYKSGGVAGYLGKTARGEVGPYGVRVKNALESDDAWGKSPRVQALVVRLRPLLERLCLLWDENHRLIYSEGIVRRRLRSFGLLHDLSQIVGTLCQEQNVMPIARTNRILGRLTQGNDAPFIFEKTGNHFSRFLIDEFQDTSRVQWENFLPLLHNALAQSSERTVMLVGDVKQSIYRWRGGDWRLLAHDATRTLGEAMEENLAVNRRSLPRIVEFNNEVIARVVAHDQSSLAGLLDEARQKGYLTPDHAARLTAMPVEAYEAHRQIPASDKQGGYVTLTLRPAEAPDIDPVILRVRELLGRGYAPSDIAILVRRNAEARQIAALLLGAGHDVVTSEALQIGACEAVQAIVACMRLSLDPSDALALALLNRHLGRALHEPLSAHDEALIAALRTCSPQEAFHRIVMRLGVPDDRIAYIQALDEQIVRYCETNIADTALFLEWWDERGRKENIYMPQSRSAIGIFTIHAAKGLERKAVILPYASWPLAPNSSTTLWVDTASTPFEEAGRLPVVFEKSVGQSCFAADYYDELVASHIDNINLLYVALTRARDELHLYLPRRKPASEPTQTGDLLLAVLGEEFSVGEPVAQPPEAHDDTRIAVGYPVAESGPKVRLRLPATRYLDDGLTPAISPRSYGVLMHRLFEHARTPGELTANLAALEQDGIVSPQEVELLAGRIERALRDERIAAWFSGKWDEVRNENDILLPHASTRRPDRVMMRGREAMVVDYKFGSKVDPAHRKQIEEYMEIMRRMGYREVRGYIWYITLEQITEV